MFKIFAAGESDVGMKRETNQDSIFLDPEKGIFIQADGMGGHRGGKEASSIAVGIVSELLLARADFPAYSDSEIAAMAGRDGAERSVMASILAANQAVTSKGQGDNSDLKGMGSTIDVLYIDNDKAVIGHVGDSRVYRAREGELTQLTSDHSLINELVERYKLTPEEVAALPYGNRITRALGYLTSGAVDIISEKIENDDIFLLCSDGLTNVVDDATILDTLIKSREKISDAPGALISIANNAGGPDNISVVLARFLNQLSESESA